jgi:DNA-binding NarL/FixJ family response regulator
MSAQSAQAASPEEAAQLSALCIARHCFLSEHIAQYFARMGLITTQAVGLEAAIGVARGASPDLVICDYDLLATIPLEKWERDELLSNIPVVAVSLTRHSQELHLLDVNGIAGFLYLPTLDTAPALKILRAAAARSKYTLPQPVNTAPRTLERG